MTINNAMDNLRKNIEPYLLDRLDKESTQEFERAMNADPQLALEVEQTRCIVTSFEKRGESRAFEAMRTLNSEEALRAIMTRAENGHNRRRGMARIYLWSASAAAVILIVLVGIQPKYSSETLYHSYFTAQQHFETTPSRGGAVWSPEQSEMLLTATKLYRQNNYSTAADIYAKALKGLDKDDIPEDVHLYYAISLMQIDSTDKAIDMLRSISENDQAELQDQARWNLALALLKTGQRHEATAIMDELIRARSAFATCADELKIKINKRRWF